MACKFGFAPYWFFVLFDFFGIFPRSLGNGAALARSSPAVHSGAWREVPRAPAASRENCNESRACGGGTGLAPARRKSARPGALQGPWGSCGYFSFLGSVVESRARTRQAGKTRGGETWVFQSGCCLGVGRLNPKCRGREMEIRFLKGKLSLYQGVKPLNKA